MFDIKRLFREPPKVGMPDFDALESAMGRFQSAMDGAQRHHAEGMQVATRLAEASCARLEEISHIAEDYTHSYGRRDALMLRRSPKARGARRPGEPQDVATEVAGEFATVAVIATAFSTGGVGL